MSLPTITSLKTISDMTEVGFEWNPVTDESVVGYYLYRSNLLYENYRRDRRDENDGI